MAIDPSIALQYKPIELQDPVNRMANIQGIQANQLKLQAEQRAQEEATNIRNYLTGGGDLSSPELFRAGVTPETGIKLQTAALQQKKLQNDLVSERMKTSREMLSNVTTPEEYLAWSKANHDDPILGPQLTASGVTHEQTIAKVNEALKIPGGFQGLLLQSSAGLEKALSHKLAQQKFEDESKRGWANVGVAQGQLGVAQGQLGVAQDRLNQETAAGAMTPKTVDFAANIYTQTGVMPSFGFGKNAADMRAQVLNRAAELSTTPATSGGVAPTSAEAAAKIVSAAQNVKSATKAVAAFNTGQQGNAVRSIGVAIDHMDTVSKLGDALQNGNNQAFNKLAQSFGTLTGNPAPTNLNAAAHIVGAEVTKAIVANGGGQAEREAAAETFSNIQSPAQLRGAIATYKGLLSGQLKGLKQQYETSTGRTDFDSKLSTGAKALVTPTQTATPSAPAGGQAAPAPAQSGLTPTEQAELAALKKKHGR